MKNLIIAPHLAFSTPFLEYDDGTRLQMCSSQARQVVPLVNPDIPMVQTTFEKCIDVLTPDVYIAEDEGEIIFKSNRAMVIKYDDKYRLYRYTSEYQTYKEEKEKVNKGDLLASRSTYIKDETVCLGKNLVVGIFSHPYTYEDSIVMSDEISEQELFDSYKYEIIDEYIDLDEVLLSIDDKTYKPIPEINDIIPAGSPLLRVIKLSKKDPLKLFYEPKEIILNDDCEILDVSIIPNKFSNYLREYELKMIEYIKNNDYFKDYIDKIEMPEIIRKRLYQIHDIYDHKKDIKVKDKSLTTYVRLFIRYKEKVNLGDKFCNRHANKGVLSKIIKKEEMPLLPDGRRVQMIVNPMSIISRMNLGQLYEIAASNIIFHLKKKIKEMTNLEDAKKLVKDLYSMIDKTEEKWIISQMNELLDKITTLDEIKEVNFVFPAPPFESCNYKDMDRIMRFLEVPHEYECTYNNEKIKLNVGYMYIYRLFHMARHKFAGRSIAGFSGKSFQPLSGRQREGGQRFGEMEAWCLAAYDAESNLSEISMKSDDITKKIQYFNSVIYDVPGTINEDNPESLKLLNSYLNVLGSVLEDK